MAVDKKELFITQGFDGVQPGGFHRRPDAENKADTDADGDARGSGPHLNDARPAQGETDEEDEKIYEDQSDDAAGSGEGHRLQEELPGDVAVFGADGLANADLAGAFGDADEHDIHDPDTANKQSDRTENHGREADLVDDLVILGGDLFRGREREIVSSAVGDTAAALQQFANLIERLVEHAGIGLRAQIDLVGGRIDFLEGAVGDEDAAVGFIGAKAAFLFLKHSDHDKIGAVNQHVLADGMAVRKKNRSDVFADEYDLFPVQIVAFTDKTAVEERFSGIDKPEVALNTAKIDARHFAALGANGVRLLPGGLNPGSGSLDGGTIVGDGLGIVGGQGLALEFFLRTRSGVAKLIPLGDEDGVCPNLVDAFLDLAIEPGDQRGYEHDDADAKNHAKNREGAAHLVRAERVDRLQEIFGVSARHRLRYPSARKASMGSSLVARKAG